MLQLLDSIWQINLGLILIFTFIELRKSYLALLVGKHYAVLLKFLWILIGSTLFFSGIIKLVYLGNF